MMGLRTMIFVATLTAVAYGNPCQDISGYWRNDLGSNMSIESVSHDRFIGKYLTAVESSPNAQDRASDISGVIQPIKDGSLVAWTVLYNNGENIATWVGQCMVCDGKEILYTTFLLRFLTEEGENWKSTIVNYNTFWREDDLSNDDYHLSMTEIRRSAWKPNSVHEQLVGKWQSTTGDSFTITDVRDSGALQGMVVASPLLTYNPSLYGSYDGEDGVYAALGFVASFNSRIKGWAGHIIDPQEYPVTMATTWLEHSFCESCKDPRRFVRFSATNYTGVPDGPYYGV